MTSNMVCMVSHGLFERMACEESGFTRKSRKWGFGAAVGLKQTMQTMQTMQPPSDDAPDVEADERLAIQTEHQLATRQSIPQERMVAGLMKAAKVPSAKDGGAFSDSTRPSSVTQSFTRKPSQGAVPVWTLDGKLEESRHA